MPKRKDLLLNCATGLVTVIAIVCGSFVIVAHIRAARSAAAATQTTTQQAARVANWARYAAGALSGEREGPTNARVTIVEFADLQCPYCAKTDIELKRILQEHPSGVALVYRNFPLPIHPDSRAAARAGECAAAQGRFPAFRDLVYSNQDEIGLESWSGFAKRAGVGDLKKFNACLSDDSLNSQIIVDLTAGNQLGVEGTPTILVNGVELRGYDNGAGTLESLVARDLRASEKPIAESDIAN